MFVRNSHGGLRILEQRSHEVLRHRPPLQGALEVLMQLQFRHRVLLRRQKTLGRTHAYLRYLRLLLVLRLPYHQTLVLYAPQAPQARLLRVPCRLPPRGPSVLLLLDPSQAS